VETLLKQSSLLSPIQTLRVYQKHMFLSLIT
jgi:hypothetical protein